MLLSNTTAYLDDRFSVKETIKIFKNAGFDAYDISLSHLYVNENLPSEWNREDFREKALEIRQYADNLGIVCNQSHAPYPSSTGNEAEDNAIFERIVAALEIASILGAKIIVVHPKQHLEYKTHADELFEMNIEFYRSLIPYCEKFGIKVAVENMWQWDNEAKKIVDSTCASPEEFCRYLDTINSRWIVGCLDIGHSTLVGRDIADFIKILGNKRLLSLHIHDVDGVSDLHTMPFVANIDFDSVCNALAEIDYKGDFTYEACSFLHKLPTETCETACKLLCEVGRYLIKKIENKR